MPFDLENLRALCPELAVDLMDRHCRCQPKGYSERYATNDIAVHLRLVAQWRAEGSVGCAFRSHRLGGFDVWVVGGSRPGVLACITAALAAEEFNLEDVHIFSFRDPLAASEAYFLVHLRVSGGTPHSATDHERALRHRLSNAFRYLAQGNFVSAQSAATAPLPETSPSHVDRVRQGRIVGNDFRLLTRLGGGGQSELWLAEQLSLSRSVAVKITLSAASELALERFTREAGLLASFTCPYIVAVLAAGTFPEGHGECGWLALEYLAGGDLAQRLRTQGRPPVEQALRWFRQALEGLLYAHQHGILHRDLKPHNLLLTADDNLKLADFGLFQSLTTGTTATLSTAVLGTPAYMSPEQALGEPLDERADIFSLGTTFFHVFSGRLPFEGTDASSMMEAIVRTDAPRLTTVAPHLPGPLGLIIGRMLARRPEERYQHVGVTLADLESYAGRHLLIAPPNAPTECDRITVSDTSTYASGHAHSDRG